MECPLWVPGGDGPESAQKRALGGAVALSTASHTAQGILSFKCFELNYALHPGEQRLKIDR